MAGKRRSALPSSTAVLLPGVGQALLFFGAGQLVAFAGVGGLAGGTKAANSVANSALISFHGPSPFGRSQRRNAAVRGVGAQPRSSTSRGEARRPCNRCARIRRDRRTRKTGFPGAVGVRDLVEDALGRCARRTCAPRSCGPRRSRRAASRAGRRARARGGGGRDRTARRACPSRTARGRRTLGRCASRSLAGWPAGAAGNRGRGARRRRTLRRRASTRRVHPWNGRR